MVPESRILREHVIISLNLYWNEFENNIRNLPINVSEISDILLPLKLIEIELPDWAIRSAVNGKLLVPQESVKNEKNWKKVDWFLAIFLLLENCHEREWEKRNGLINSYSFQLMGWDERAWQRAWVNRIAIFLSEWAEFEFGVEIPKPKGTIIFTHDVDAVRRNSITVIKRLIFILVKILRRRRVSKNHLIQIFDILLSRDSWNKTLRIIEIEEKFGIKSIFYIYSKVKNLNLIHFLINPSYSLNSIKKSQIFEILSKYNLEIGLHGSYSKKDSYQIERKNLEECSQRKVTKNRNHWLRFEWASTWQELENAGFLEDSTLMFNDIPGFRNSSCLTWSAWNRARGAAFKMSMIPTVIMDSHYNDYVDVRESDTLKFQQVIDEVYQVGGFAQILWHPHTLSKSFGWEKSFIEICDYASRKNLISE